MAFKRVEVLKIGLFFGSFDAFSRKKIPILEMQLFELRQFFKNFLSFLQNYSIKSEIIISIEISRLAKFPQKRLFFRFF